MWSLPGRVMLWSPSTRANRCWWEGQETPMDWTAKKTKEVPPAQYWDIKPPRRLKNIHPPCARVSTWREDQKRPTCSIHRNQATKQIERQSTNLYTQIYPSRISKHIIPPCARSPNRWVDWNWKTPLCHMHMDKTTKIIVRRPPTQYTEIQPLRSLKDAHPSCA